MLNNATINCTQLDEIYNTGVNSQLQFFYCCCIFAITAAMLVALFPVDGCSMLLSFVIAIAANY